MADPAEQVPTSLPRHSRSAIANRTLDSARGSRARPPRGRDSRSSNIRRRCRSMAGRPPSMSWTTSVPLVEPMVEGEARPYDATEQQRLAGWSLSSTPFSRWSVRARGVPRSHRRVLREREEPHENVFVGFDATAEATSACSGGSWSRSASRTTPEVEAYTVAAVFGHLVLKVFGIRRRPAVRHAVAAGRACALGPRTSRGRPGRHSGASLSRRFEYNVQAGAVLPPI